MEQPQRFRQIKEALEVPIPFPNDPRVIPWGLKRSLKSWGDMEKASWEHLL